MDLSLTPQQEAFVAEAEAWLAANHEPPPDGLSDDEAIEWGRRWQRRLAEGRWVGLDWPTDAGGRGASALEVALFNLVYARTGAPQPVNRVGLSHAGPTIIAHGTDEQRQRFLPPLLRADEIWSQMFSEPQAGSDLASLQTTATPTDGGWVVSGQKVWTSYAQYARWGICLVRTDPDAKKHAGLSYLVVDMQADGIDIRPLRQLTGEEEFSEVFMDEVFVPREHLVGDENDGWRVAATTLAHERGIGFPFKEQAVQEVWLRRLVDTAADQGLLDDLLVAEDVAQAYIDLRLLAIANLRTISRLEAGEEAGPETSWVKLQWSNLTQHQSALGARLFPDDPEWQRQGLWSLAATIAGGTSEIQRTILADRALGLPRG